MTLVFAIQVALSAGWLIGWFSCLVLTSRARRD